MRVECGMRKELETGKIEIMGQMTRRDAFPEILHPNDATFKKIIRMWTQKRRSGVRIDSGRRGKIFRKYEYEASGEVDAPTTSGTESLLVKQYIANTEFTTFSPHMSL